MLLLRNLTYRNSDVNTANAEKAITATYNAGSLPRLPVQKQKWYTGRNWLQKWDNMPCPYNQCWRPTKMKYLEWRPYQTRQRARLHKKVGADLMLYTILCPGYIIISTLTPISKYYPLKIFNKSSYKSLANVQRVPLRQLTERI